MADLWMDGFEHYGSGIDCNAVLLTGPSAEVSIIILVTRVVIVLPF